MIKKNSNLMVTFFVMFDFLFLVGAYFLAKYIEFGAHFTFFTKREIFSCIIIVVFLFFSLQKVEYSHKYRLESLSSIVFSIVLFELLIMTTFYLFSILRIFHFSLDLVRYYIIITSIFFIAERITVKVVLSILRHNGYNLKNFLIIGAGELGQKFYSLLENNGGYGINTVGFLDDKFDKKEFPDSVKKKLIGGTDVIEELLQAGTIDNVVITLPSTAEDNIIRITNLCEKYGIKAELIPDYYKLTSGNPSIRVINGYPLIGIRNVPLENMFNRMIKRLFDISLSIAGLIILMPLFLIIMPLIKLTSKGPIFFKQKRTGYKQKEFYIYKFRTMKVNAEADSVQASADDPRKTPFGDLLRRTNIDELPQLFNILYGDMSIVGPRPHMISHTEEFYKKYDKYMVRHWVKPGLTGWAQVNGWRGDSDIGIRVKYDIEYIENWSIWLDIKIMFLTIFGKKVRNNAY